MGTDISRFNDFMRTRKDEEQPEMDEMCRLMAEEVIANPALAGLGVDVGNWERGEIGACKLVYPSLKQAQDWMADSDG